MMHSTQRVSLTRGYPWRYAWYCCRHWGAVRRRSAGIMLYEQGTPDVGLASAGQGARAQDAGTVLTNPAGMTQLKDSQLLIGIVPNFGNFTFSPNAKTSHKGTDGGNAAVPLPGGSSLRSQPEFEPEAGLWQSLVFRRAMEDNRNWVGRYRLQGATILGTSFSHPSRSRG